MHGICERCRELLYLFPMGGRYYCARCFSDRRRRLTSAYRGPERRIAGAENPRRLLRRRDDLDPQSVRASA